MSRLFIYGSLKQGTQFHQEFLSQSKKEPTALIDGFAMYDSNQGYPYLIRDTKQIKCESYLVDEKTLKEIDDFEDHPHYYRREIVKSINGRQGWIYLYQGSCEGLDEISDSVWAV